LFNTQAPPDGAGIPRLYQEIFREAEVAEEVGFDSVFLPEHHMMADGYIPQALILLAAIAGRTENLRVGTSIMHLLERNPIHVAEEVAVLDNLSGGRVSLGVGLNLLQEEFDLFDVPMAGATRRFEEQIEVLRRAWADDALRFDGEFYSYDGVSITPRVVQRPGPPLMVGAMADASVRRAGRLGCDWLCDPLTHWDTAAAWAEMFHAEARAHGHGDGPRVVMMRDGWVGDERELREVWWPTIQTYHLFYKSLGLFTSGRFNTTYEPWVETATDAEWTYDRVLPERALYGSVDEVVEEIGRYQVEFGIDEMILAFRHSTGPSHEQTLEVIERFGREVIPQFHSPAVPIQNARGGDGN
jgi:alkanesulfonate monooxygenase SsuD/methylene tetrahydromethanopterin reductase-like flavin-dependent oxidoreductase (luciferase family)